MKGFAMSDVVISARITSLPRPMPEGMLDPMPKVYATTKDKTEHLLFEYYPDEISFAPGDFVGLTLDEARGLKVKKDVAFLQSPSM
jgi:hypothetical protein